MDDHSVQQGAIGCGAWDRLDYLGVLMIQRGVRGVVMLIVNDVASKLVIVWEATSHVVYLARPCMSHLGVEVRRFIARHRSLNERGMHP